MCKRLPGRVLLMLLVWLWLALLQPGSGSLLGGFHHAGAEPTLKASANPQPSSAMDPAHAHSHAHGGVAAEQGAGMHSHGHSPVDHLQDAPLPPRGSQELAVHATRWAELNRFVFASAPLAGLERPPKSPRA